MPNSLVDQLRKFKAEQRRELLEIERKERELADRQAELYAMKLDVTRGLIQTEKALEERGIWD